MKKFIVQMRRIDQLSVADIIPLVVEAATDDDAEKDAMKKAKLWGMKAEVFSVDELTSFFTEEDLAR